ncbi:helix-turn-helix domain-containing protein [Streptomyces sp. NPDC090108]|uniref:transcriptional regulator n=1 Tax=Streptomyces sp. NPDC090108 TaxID=3365947 RepID=UPI003811B638
MNETPGATGAAGVTAPAGVTAEASALAGLLRDFKDRSGVSYGALAKRLHMSTSTLHRYCNGTSVPNDYAPIERLARVCRASPEELVELHRRWILADATRGSGRTPGPGTQAGARVALGADRTASPSADTVASAADGPASSTASSTAGTAVSSTASAAASSVVHTAADTEVSASAGRESATAAGAAEPVSAAGDGEGEGDGADTGRGADVAGAARPTDPGPAADPSSVTSPPAQRWRRRTLLLACAGAAAALAAAVIVGNPLPPGHADGSRTVAGTADDAKPTAGATTSRADRRGAGKPSPSSASPSPSERVATKSAAPAGPPASAPAGTRPAGERPVAVPVNVATRPFVYESPCSQHFLVDSEPEQVGPPAAEQDAPRWAAAYGAVSSGEQRVGLTVQGAGSDTVVLEALHVRVLTKAAPLAWNDYSMGVGCGGRVDTKSFGIDLDSGSPTVTAGSGGRDFPYKVSESDPEVFYITAHTRAHDVRWDLTLDWSSGDRHGTVHIDDNGRPFHTSGSTGRPGYDYPLGGSEWIPRE